MAENRDKWDQEDLDLEREFGEVAEAWRRSAGNSPRVSRSLDRKIREQSRYRVGEQLKQNWILGHGPLLILAILLLFAIGVFFVVSLENDRDDTGQSEPPAIMEQTD